MRTRVFLTISFGSVLLLVAIAWIRRVTLADPGDLMRVVLKKEIRANPIESIAYLPDGSQIVAGTGGDIVLVDSRTGDVRILASAGVGPIRSVTSRVDGGRVAAGFEDGLVVLLDPGGIAPRLAWKAHSGFVAAVAFSPDGKRVATGSDDRTARLWDASDGHPLATLEGHTSSVWGVAFSPDGKRVATGSDDRTARLWDASDGHPLAALEGTHLAMSVAFSPDGRLLAVGWGDATAKVYDAANGRVLTTLVHRKASLIRGVAFDPKSGRLATAAANMYRSHPPGEVRVWDLVDGRAIFHFEHSGGWANCVAFAPDGSSVACGSRDGLILAWDIRPDGRRRKAGGH
jgi:WD40 repeat protein